MALVLTPAQDNCTELGCTDCPAVTLIGSTVAARQLEHLIPQLEPLHQCA